MGLRAQGSEGTVGTEADLGQCTVTWAGGSRPQRSWTLPFSAQRLAALQHRSFQEALRTFWRASAQPDAGDQAPMLWAWGTRASEIEGGEKLAEAGRDPASQRRLAVRAPLLLCTPPYLLPDLPLGVMRHSGTPSLHWSQRWPPHPAFSVTHTRVLGGIWMTLDLSGSFRRDRVGVLATSLGKNTRPSYLKEERVILTHISVPNWLAPWKGSVAGRRGAARGMADRKQTVERSGAGRSALPGRAHRDPPLLTRRQI